MWLRTFQRKRWSILCVLTGVCVFGSIGATIRERSPATHTFVAGCSDGVLGYLPARTDFPAGGFEVTTAHRVYGQPAPVREDAGDRMATAAVSCLAALFGTSE